MPPCLCGKKYLSMPTIKTPPPLIVHIIFRLDFGGLENGLVNLINNMPAEKYRHAIICASEYTDFRKRIKKADVKVYALNKKPGNDLSAYYRLWKLLRKLKPDIVHTRNLGTIEYVVPAMLAGVKCRVHGEHGRDMSDIHGTNKKYIFLRRFYGKFIHNFITVSKDLETWLMKIVSIRSKKVTQIYNGVNSERFSSKPVSSQLEKKLVIGTVGRFQAEKDQATLIKAFDLLRKKYTEKDIRLQLIGDGPDREKLETLVFELDVTSSVNFHGKSDDVPNLMKQLDIFVLPSLGEGISNTILEAMSCGLPIIATNVGGNLELVTESISGYLVPANDPQAMFESIQKYIDQPELISKHGKAARERIEKDFSMNAMVENYMRVYNELLGISNKSAL